MTDKIVARLRDEIELLQEQVRQLQAVLVNDEIDIPCWYGLTAKEERLYRHLMSRRIVTDESILQALYSGADDFPVSHIVNVWICKLRRKLRPHGIKIVTHWGRGYSLEGRYTENNDGVVA